MRNRSNFVPTTLKRVSLVSGTTTYNSSGGSDFLTNSGYTGRRPSPLQPHAFSYEIKRYDCDLHRRQITTRISNGNLVDDVTWSGACASRTQPFTLSISNLERTSNRPRVLEKFNSRARGDLDLSVSVFEASQTRRMLSASQQALALAEHTGLFRKGKRLAAAAKAGSDLWLQYWYGWKPLASDIYETAKQLANTACSTFENYSVSDFYTNNSALVSFLDYTNGYSVQFNSPIQVKHRISVKLEAQDAQAANRFTSLNPASIAWELTPFSFVFDWMYDVGSYLRNTETALLYGNRFINGYETSLTAGDGPLSKSSSSSFTSGLNRITTTEKYDGTFFYRKLTRSILYAYPTPNLPSFNVDLGSRQLTTLAALAVQRMKF